MIVRFAASLLFLACAAGAARAQAPKPAAPWNVIVIGADTLRADHLGLYGYPRPTSPNLDRLAAGGVVFDHAFGQGSYTLPSFASVFTSLYPERHGALNRRARIAESAATLAQIFQSRGYRTAGFTGGPFVALPYGFGKGYDSYLSGDLPRPLDAYVPAALDWIAQDRAKPFFLFLQPQDVHPPFDFLALPKSERGRWDADGDASVEKYMGSLYFYFLLNGEPNGDDGPPPSPEIKREVDAVMNDPRARRHMISAYDDRVARFDRTFGSFWNDLQKRGLLDKTVIVLLSDHGTLFGEGGKFGHGTHLSTDDGIFHVALVVWAPGRKSARVSSLVELVDVAPTLLDLTKAPIPAAFEGHSLLPLMDGGARDGVVFGTASLTGDETRVRRFVRDRHWKLSVDDPGPRTTLVDLENDPPEEKDVSAENPGVVKRLSGELARHLQRVARPD